MQCQSDGTWNKSAGCTLKDCGTISTLPNANVTHGRTEYEFIAKVTCAVGYKLANSSNNNDTFEYMQCQSDGTWNKSAGCTLKDCGTISTLPNANVTHGRTEYESIAKVTCAVGYKLANSSNNNDTFEYMQCQSDGTWNKSAGCTLKDCGLPPTLTDGSLTLVEASKTTYGALAEVNCTPGYEYNKLIISCTDTGEWEAAYCEPHDCGAPDAFQNGNVQTPEGTTFGKTAVITCKHGYTYVGLSVIDCRPTGWPLRDNSCVIIDCGQLLNPIKGQVDMTNGTAYQAFARYMCNQGYELIGDDERMCQATGTWTGIHPTCLMKEQKKVVCPNNVDSRGTEWKEVIEGATRLQQCAEGFEGNVTRTCLSDGTWQRSQYNCVRKDVATVAKMVKAFEINVTADTVSNALGQIAKVSSNEEADNTSEPLTDAEITILAISLNEVADIVSNNSLPTSEVVKAFFQSVSNLVDERNKESWETMKQSKSTGGENMLASVDKIGVALREKVQSGEAGVTNITIVQRNVALEVKQVLMQDIIFPYADIKTDHQDEHNWAKTSASRIRLDAKAMGDNQVTVTAVIFKEMSHVLPNISYTNTGSKTHNQQINGPILSLSLSNYSGKLDPLVLLTFELKKANLTSPLCSYWKYGRNNQTGYWASDGCVLHTSDEIRTVCQCDHLTNFAVLMSPFVEADATSVPLRTVSTVGIGISMACLLITMLTYIYLWRFLKSDRTILLLNLCGALLLSYIIFVAGVDKTANKALCATTAVFLHYIYLVVFCLMLAEGIDIAIMVVYVFNTKSRLKPLLISAWVAPAVIVAISLLSTQVNGYGSERFCWLSLERGLIWAFVAPALLIILTNTMCLVLVMRNMFQMKAMESKTSTEKIKTSLRSLCVLVPLMGVSWILGIFYVNKSAAVMQYLFALFNGLQGLFIFIFHCIFNQQVRTALRNEYNKRENLKSIERSTSQKTSKFKKSFKNSLQTHSENVSSTSQQEVSEETTVGSQMHVYSKLREKIFPTKKSNLTDKKCEDPVPFSRESSSGFANVVLRAVRFTDRYSRMERSHSTKSSNKTVTTV
ncbi:adhesion G protein-coupled receptor L3-like isoform X1 [Dreissena polymorpha]|uniref:adhesion G protein-coupled receptor L3-like isoform X1 n=2 Tax=Dreissena polymorpha TaxID=45954 RepID=UPI0022651DD0|nr:adhesion G protein-coupled receptor L3-like isoform X1 [Dreissena polymorpha]